MNDIEARIARHELVSRFPRNSVGRALADQALEAWNRAEDEDAKHAVERLASAAAAHAELVFRQNAYFRDGNMSRWFSLPGTGLREIARRQSVLVDAWRRASQEEDEEEDARREEEEERIDRLEDEGAYGRTLPLHPDADRWIYIRFGGMPRSGRSAFGLIRDDTEDGPDPWRVELGGMTHEAGVSVFRAYRHPDERDGYVLIEPAFTLARYGTDASSHLLAVIPQVESGEEIPVLRVDGSLTACRGCDGTLRADLGSDGEYLIDAKKPFVTHDVPLAKIWASERISVLDFLRERRGYAPGAAPAP